MNEDTRRLSQLQRALLEGNKDLFEAYCDGEDNKDGITAEMVQLFLEPAVSFSDVAIQQFDASGKNLLHYAVAGDEDVGLLSRLFTLIGEQDRFGLSPLMLAAKMNRIRWVSALSEHECGLRDVKGRTALMYAAYASNFDIFERLFDEEWFILDQNGLSVLAYLWGKSAQYERYHALFEEKVLAWGVPTGCAATKSRAKLPQIGNVRKLQNKLIDAKTAVSALKQRFFALEEMAVEQQNVEKINEMAELQCKKMRELEQEEQALESRVEAINAKKKQINNMQLQVNALKAEKYGILAPPEIIKSAALLPPMNTSAQVAENTTPTSLELSNSSYENVRDGGPFVDSFKPIVQEENAVSQPAAQLTAAQLRRVEMQKRIRDALKGVADV